MSNEQETTTIEESADAMLSAGLAKMRQAYWAHVRECAQSLYARARDEKMDRETFIDTMHEDIDGDGWVIYTNKAQAVCMVSENDGAYVDNFGADGLVKDGAIDWSGLAYCALEADVYEQLGCIDGFDINAGDLGLSEEAEEEADGVAT